VLSAKKLYQGRSSNQNDTLRAIISTTKIAMLHKELPLDRKFVNDSWPGVSMTSRPGILYSWDPSWEEVVHNAESRQMRTHLVQNSSFGYNSL
jgi:hypothetical protein